MKEIKIKQLAYYLKEAKKKNKPQPIFFLGAGASVTGDIPLARKITCDILEKFSDNPAFEELKDEDKEYAKLMALLSPDQRNELLKNYIDQAKINVTHIYLAQLLKNDFADYVLTVNFDNLMLRALALYNIFPPTYDMAILKDLTTTTFPEKSVVYLHGQHHGLWLLNTEDEMGKVAKTVPRIFDRISNKRPWIFIGYSGSDPIFEHICNIGRFDNGLYWVGYNDSNPHSEVSKFLSDPHKNAYYIKGYDADAFMLKLNQELGLEQPQILSKPFSSLKDMLEEINDINDEDHFKPVKERLEIAKKNVSKAIEQFEEGKLDMTTSERELQIDNLKQEIIELSIAENYDETKIALIEKQVKELNDQSLNESLARLYFDWGYELGNLAGIEKGVNKEKLLNKAIEKYKKATQFNPENKKAFNNWGVDLELLSETKKGKEKEVLLNNSIEKYEEAIKIDPYYGSPFYGIGTNLMLRAKLKKGDEREKLFDFAFEKLQKAIFYGSQHYNMACLQSLRKNKKEALKYLESSLKRGDQKVNFVLKDEDWQHYLEDKDFKAIIEKYKT